MNGSLSRSKRTAPSDGTKIRWKLLIMITLGPALFDNNNRWITLSGGYLTQFIVTTFYMYKT
jgi:hypothetical protein